MEDLNRFIVENKVMFAKFEGDAPGVFVLVKERTRSRRAALAQKAA